MTEAEQAAIVEQYKSIRTRTYVNRQSNDPEKLDYDSMSHEQLKTEAKRLQSHVTQLKNLLVKSQNRNESNHKKRVHKQRPFDFAKYNRRHVLVKFAYLGW